MATKSISQGEETLRGNHMMSYLMDNLEAGTDIGHYGRLVFVMVARHFLDENEMVSLLTRDKTFPEEEAQSLVRQVAERDYSPPGREKIREFESRQDFAILPDTDDPDEGNVYRDLSFPEHVYEHIQDYYEHKTTA